MYHYKFDQLPWLEESNELIEYQIPECLKDSQFMNTSLHFQHWYDHQHVLTSYIFVKSEVEIIILWNKLSVIIYSWLAFTLKLNLTNLAWFLTTLDK